MDKDKLKTAIEFARQNPESDFANELRKRIETGQIVIEPEKPSYIERVGEQFENIAERTTEALKKSGEGYLEKAQSGDVLGATGELLRSGLRSVGAVTEGAFAPITEAPVIKQALDFIGEKIGNTEVGQKLARKIQENPETAQDIMDIVNTLTLGGGKAIEKPITVGVEKAVAGGKEALETGIKTLKTKEAIKTASQVDDLVGKIVQGTEKDISRAKKALGDIDTTNIKSYKDLSGALNDKVSNLTSKLDDILSQNTTKIQLEDAKNIIKVGEKSVEHNFVKDAISQLEEYFTKINDIKGRETITQLKNKFKTDGVTIKDINDLARLHGEKMNAYNSSGELASGLTKQGAENTRAGLKSTARDLFGDNVFKEIDSEISNVIRTRDLVDNVSKKVTQLQQKINERGFGEKVGRLVFQVADKFTGGGLKGFVQSFVPRGEGLKIMNALDLERSLNKNLKLLDKAMNSKTESATIKALQGILDYIENPKMGMSIEDVSKKNQSSDAFLKSQPTTNMTNKKSISPNSTTKGLKAQGEILETNLIKEAKKYKSAEEFVKAQQPISHYTAQKFNKFDLSKTEAQSVWFTDNPKIDLKTGQGLGSAQVGTGGAKYKMDRYINPKSKIIDIEKSDLADKYTSGQLIDMGYSGIKVPQLDGSNWYEIWEPNKDLITKSQLEEIWNKANKK